MTLTQLCNCLLRHVRFIEIVWEVVEEITVHEMFALIFVLSEELVLSDDVIDFEFVASWPEATVEGVLVVGVDLGAGSGIARHGRSYRLMTSQRAMYRDW